MQPKCRLCSLVSFLILYCEEIAPGSVGDLKDSWDWTGVKTIAPEGAIFSLATEGLEVRG